MLGSSPARTVSAPSADLQPLRSDDEEIALPCFPGGDLPQALKDDLDSIPAPRGTSRRGKLIILAVVLGSLLAGVIVLAFCLEHLTRGSVTHKTFQERADWFNAGAYGLPPGYCEEPAMVLSTDDTINHVDWAKSLVDQMTEEEKYRLIHGIGFDGFKAKHGYYIGNVLAVPRLGIPSIKMQDGTAGFRTTEEDMVGQVTSWPCSLALSASWDKDLVEEWAAAAGGEFKAKGANMVLGPAVNVHRVPYSGRNAEYISGEDPTLGRILAPAYVRGMQQGAGIAAVVKHFAMNEQETGRTSENSKADDRVRWERYYPPFQSAVDANVAAVMCSYNSVNGKQACSNAELLTNDLKGMMGFEGWVMSDWWALKDNFAAAAGTDMDMPGNDDFFSKKKLDGVLPPSRLDRMAERTLVGMSRSGAWNNLPGNDCRVGCNCEDPLYRVVATNQDNVDLARKVATRGAVLLRNEASPKTGKPVLPFTKQQKITVVGGACGIKPYLKQQMKSWTEASYYWLGGSSRVLSEDTVSLTEGLKAADVNPTISWGDEIGDARQKMQGADVAIVCAGATATESVDRDDLRLDQEAFVSQVVAAGAQMQVPVVVLAYAPGAVLMPWRNQATAVLLMFPSGQTTGLAVADVLLGQVNPSAKLPVTIPEREEDTMRPCNKPDCPYEEGLKGGWHLYDGKPVAYPFGFGLSYTQFEYSPGELSDLREDSSRQLVVKVKNVGDRAGAEVVQLYLRFPTTSPALALEPPQILRRFERTRELQPGETQNIIFEIGPRDEMIWETSAGSWKMIFGKFSVGIGASSRDLRLCGAYNNQLGVIQTPEVPMGKCPRPDLLQAADG